VIATYVVVEESAYDLPAGEYLIRIFDGNVTLAYRPNANSTWLPPVKAVQQ
jgi:hypothetical protein